MECCRRFLVALTGLVGPLLFSNCPADAATITYTNTFAPSPVSQFWDESVTWPQFDPAAGTLESVAFTLGGALDLTRTNTTANPIEAHWSWSIGITLNGTGITYKSPIFEPFDQLIIFTNAGGPVETLSGGASVTDTFPIDILKTPDLGIADFIGPGLVHLNIGISEDSDLCNSDPSLPRGLACTNQQRFIGGVTYTYDPVDQGVPEPVSAVLLAFGLTALVGLRLKHRA